MKPVNRENFTRVLDSIYNVGDPKEWGSKINPEIIW